MLSECTGFEWDEGNADKNWLLHQVRRNECEQVFFNQPLVVSDDERHSVDEKSWYVLGKTDKNRFLFVVFTVRKNMIRVISARDMSKKERRIYEERIK